jgi:hypothetical protein
VILNWGNWLLNEPAPDDDPCTQCGAVPGTEEYGTVGDGFDGLCPSCADAVEPEEED